MRDGYGQLPGHLDLREIIGNNVAVGMFRDVQGVSPSRVLIRWPHPCPSDLRLLGRGDMMGMR